MSRQFVGATGETHSVCEFLDVVFDRLKLDAKRLADLDRRLTGPAELDILKRDNVKAKCIVGMETAVKANELAEMMVASDLELTEREKVSLG
jgi:GDP-D-mannose dehydratase